MAFSLPFERARASKRARVSSTEKGIVQVLCLLSDVPSLWCLWEQQGGFRVYLTSEAQLIWEMV